MSQLPETVQEPVVTVMIPLVPPTIVTEERVTVDAFDVRIPPSPTLSPPVPRERSEVASSVVDDVSKMDSVPAHCSPRVAMVNTCAVPAELENVTLLNSGPVRFEPAKAIVPPVAESNNTVPVPALQEVSSVEAFVHVPLTVHVSLPKEIALSADEMFTAPVIITSPAVLVRSPPLIVRPPLTVRVWVPLASMPPDSVRVAAVSWLNSVRVPPDISNESKD